MQDLMSVEWFILGTLCIASAAVAVWFLGFFVADRQIAWIDNAKSKPFLDSIAQSLVNMLPEDIDEFLPGGSGTADNTEA